jgi:hypothetical protein
MSGMQASDDLDALVTRLPASRVLQELAERHGAFIAEAYGPVAPGPAARAGFRATLRRLWGLGWENCHKEPLWRLAVHGIAGFPAINSQAARCGGARLRAAARCPCGARITGAGACWVRWHLFWDCFVARSLREVMGAAMGAAVGGSRCLSVPPPLARRCTFGPPPRRVGLGGPGGRGGTGTWPPEYVRCVGHTYSALTCPSCLDCCGAGGGRQGSSRLVRVSRDCPAELALRAPRPPILVLCVGPCCDERAPGTPGPAPIRGPGSPVSMKEPSASVYRAVRLPWWGGPCLAHPADVLFVTVMAPLAPVF